MRMTKAWSWQTKVMHLCTGIPMHRTDVHKQCQLMSYCNFISVNHSNLIHLGNFQDKKKFFSFHITKSKFFFYQENIPLGWHIRCGESSDDLNYYNEENDDVWGRSMDDSGKVYYYKVNGTETAWELPEVRNKITWTWENALYMTLFFESYKSRLSPEQRKKMKLFSFILPYWISQLQIPIIHF